MTQNDYIFFEELNNFQSQNWVRAIDSNKIFNWIDDLFFILFPEKKLEVLEIEKLWQKNKTDLSGIIAVIDHEKSESEIVEITIKLFNQIPTIYNSLQKDALAILNTDPAADCISEIINSYPGFFHARRKSIWVAINCFLSSGSNILI